MNRKSDIVGIGYSTTASDDDEFINNIANDLTTLVNTGEIAILDSLQKVVNVMIKPFNKFRKQKFTSMPDHHPRSEKKT